jgi:hypothetical protein
MPNGLQKLMMESETGLCNKLVSRPRGGGYLSRIARMRLSGSHVNGEVDEEMIGELVGRHLAINDLPVLRDENPVDGPVGVLGREGTVVGLLEEVSRPNLEEPAGEQPVDSRSCRA